MLKYIYTIILLLTFNLTAQSHFKFTETEDYYSIVINSATIGSISLENGDEIGVFFRDDNNNLVCGGAVVWPNNALKAWEDDQQTTNIKDGFEISEDLVFKFYDNSTNQEFDNIDTSWSVGDGTFGNGIYGICDLSYISAQAPEIQSIPEQTIDEGQNFTDIMLDNYVLDPDNADNEIIWTTSGNKQLAVSINHRVATITIPDENWNGIEAITFKATDPDGLFDLDTVFFNVNPINDPPKLVDLPDYLTLNDSSSFVLRLNDHINDVDSPISTMRWEFDYDSTYINLDYDGLTNVVLLTGKQTGESKIIITVEDDSLSMATDTITVQIITALLDNKVKQTNKLFLHQNYPNPFNPSTTIVFFLLKLAHVDLSIYNTLGQKKVSLLDGILPAGQHQVKFEANDLATGIYIYKLQTPEQVLIRKMLLMK